MKNQGLIQIDYMISSKKKLKYIMFEEPLKYLYEIGLESLSIRCFSSS